MQSNRLTLLLVVVAALALAGCAGADGGNGPGTTVAAGDGGSGGAGGSSSWCPAGQSMQMTNPQTGEQASWEVKGLVQEDGREVCRMTWESNQGDVRQVELFFTEDDSYRKMVTYDADGNVVNEVQLTGGASGGDGGSDGGANTVASWCGEMGSMQFTDPQTGEQASFEVQGVVDYEGRQVCKAVWQTNQGEVRRVEMYFDEDRSYQKLIYLDADGNVVNEIEVGSG